MWRLNLWFPWLQLNWQQLRMHRRVFTTKSDESSPHLVSFRDCGATFQMWEGTISDSIFGGGGGTKHFFLLILYNFKNIWGGACTPRSLVLISVLSSVEKSFDGIVFHYLLIHPFHQLNYTWIEYGLMQVSTKLIRTTASPQLLVGLNHLVVGIRVVNLSHFIVPSILMEQSSRTNRSWCGCAE